MDPAIAESHMGPEPMITVGPHQVITPTGLYSAVVALGIAIGAPAAGPLVGALGPAGGIAVTAGVFVGAGLLALFLLPGPPGRCVCRRLKSNGNAFRNTARARNGSA